MAKKSFKDDARSAASFFISEPEKADTNIPHDDINNESLITEKPLQLKKDKRLNLLIPSSVYSDLKKIAYVRQISVNHLITLTMQELISENKDQLERYELITSSL